MFLLSISLLASLAGPSLADPLPSAVSSPADSVTWVIDVTHSELTFKIRHFASRVRGQFNTWQGTIAAPSDKSFDAGTVSVTIDASSVDTNNEKRDNDLRSDNFFDVTKFPTITFKSTKATVAEDQLTLWGDLTIKGITKPVVLKGTYNGVVPDGRGGMRAGFEASTKINRLDWNVTWNRAVEGGGLMLGDEVEITIAIEAFQPKG